jgi:hypothetical protein
MKLTALEQDVLRAFWRSEYQDGDAQPSIWSWSVTDHCQLATPKQVPGVMSSLAKKGLISVTGDTGNEAAASVTEAGFAAAKAAGLITSTKLVGTGEWQRPYWAATAPKLVTPQVPALPGVTPLGIKEQPVYRMGPSIVQIAQLDDLGVCTHLGVAVVKETKGYVDLRFNSPKHATSFLAELDARQGPGWDQPLWYMAACKAAAAAMRKQGAK